MALALPHPWEKRMANIYVYLQKRRSLLDSFVSWPPGVCESWQVSKYTYVFSNLNSSVQLYFQGQGIDLLLLLIKILKLFSKLRTKEEPKSLHAILNHNTPSSWLNNISVDFISEIAPMPNALIYVEILQMWDSLH